MSLMALQAVPCEVVFLPFGRRAKDRAYIAMESCSKPFSGSSISMDGVLLVAFF